MILVLNIGSTSIKYKVFKGNELRLVESFQTSGFSSLDKKLTSILKTLKKYPISAVGHRVVHGGIKYTKPSIVTHKVFKELEKLNDLAPLHNPYNLKGIALAKEYFTKAKQVAVFDTGFYSTLPMISKRYAIPNAFYTKYNMRKFGFHGISHEYALYAAAKRLNRPLSSLNLITCHLGGGSSITAIKAGKATDTTMGYTPLAGLPMGTRCGNIDPGIILELLMNKKYKLTPAKLYNILYHESGLKSIYNTNDFRKIVSAKAKKNKNAIFAFNFFAYSIQKQIGAYFAVLGKIDALVFTGSIGAGKSITRNAITKNLGFLKKTPIIAIQANEEYIIAKKVENS